jgi:hypothetical protein
MDATSILSTLVGVAGAIIGWFIINHVSDVKDKITELRGHVLKIDDEVNNLGKNVVKIQTSLDFMKEQRRQINNNPQATVIREAKGKFE